MVEGESRNMSKHFVLVHGAGQGSWNWFKTAPLLKSEGHRVTAMDLAASGVRPESLSDVHTFRDYSKPLLDLLESLPEGETVILVGHSLGGLNVAFAMETFPEKISAAVFVTAVMPACSAPPSSVLEQFFATAPPDLFLDTQFSRENNNENVMLVGPECFRLRVAQNCSAEEQMLGEMLARPTSVFMEDVSASPNLSEEKYGSVRRVFIVCKEDRLLPEEFQRWMIQNNPPEKVMEIEGADHMPMLCKPNELSLCLLKIGGGH